MIKSNKTKKVPHWHRQRFLSRGYGARLMIMMIGLAVMIIPVWVLSVAEASLGGDVSKKDTATEVLLGIDEKNKEGEEGGEGVRREVCVDLVHRMCHIDFVCLLFFCYCVSPLT